MYQGFSKEYIYTLGQDMKRVVNDNIEMCEALKN